jgi:NMD protein affecting ribosome stability and mRNA decay
LFKIDCAKGGCFQILKKKNIIFQVKQNTFIQKSIEVEFVEVEAICDECRKEFTPHKWSASVQVYHFYREF